MDDMDEPPQLEPKSVVISKHSNVHSENDVTLRKLEKSFNTISDTYRETDVKLEDLIIKNVQEYLIIKSIRDKKKEDELHEISQMLQTFKTKGGKKFFQKK